jgi:hypothetical protein
VLRTEFNIFFIAIAGEFCSAGILPAICPTLKIEKTAGKMPALRE